MVCWLFRDFHAVGRARCGAFFGGLMDVLWDQYDAVSENVDVVYLVRGKMETRGCRYAELNRP